MSTVTQYCRINPSGPCSSAYTVASNARNAAAPYRPSCAPERRLPRRRRPNANGGSGSSPRHETRRSAQADRRSSTRFGVRAVLRVQAPERLPAARIPAPRFTRAAQETGCCVQDGFTRVAHAHLFSSVCFAAFFRPNLPLFACLRRPPRRAGRVLTAWAAWPLRWRVVMFLTVARARAPRRGRGPRGRRPILHESESTQPGTGARPFPHAVP